MSELPDFADHNDAPDANIAPVVARLEGLDAATVKKALDSKFAETHAVDPSAGIIIAPIEGTEPDEVNGQTFSYYGARILPVNSDTPNYVNPHVHAVGQEPYHILEGTHGEMNTGRIVEDHVEWDSPKPVMPGETIVVEEGQVHSLRNTGESTFDFTFASPDSHLVDKTPEQPEGDRVFTAGLSGALPPHYDE